MAMLVAMELVWVIEMMVDTGDNLYSLMDPNACKLQCHKFENCHSHHRINTINYNIL